MNPKEGEMKPRIVREWTDKHSDASMGALHSNYHGPAYLALPWPTECPYTPEAVMAACERAGLEVHSRPHYDVREWWVFVESADDPAPYPQILDPKFMAEPKKCDNIVHQAIPYGGYVKCLKCGAILSDRRTGKERRDGKQRRRTCMSGSYYVGGRRLDGGERRSGTDRRSHV